MARKKTMATTRKPTKKVGKMLEFFRALSGFWPVWLSALVILVGVVGYQYWETNKLINNKTKMVAENNQINISTAQIKVTGKLKYLSKLSIRKLIFKNVKSGFLTTDLNQIKTFVEAEPWVKSATVKRLPMDILLLHIEEQQPMLRWGNKGLVSVQGEVFEPDDFIKSTEFDSYPAIVSEKESIVEGLELLTYSIPVMRNLELNLAQISEDKIGAWEIKTVQGVTLKFGRKNLRHRLKILEKLWPFALKKGSLKLVDLRYSNGAAVSYL